LKKAYSKEEMKKRLFDVHTDFKEFTKTMSGDFAKVEEQPNKYQDLKFD